MNTPTITSDFARDIAVQNRLAPTGSVRGIAAPNPSAYVLRYMLRKGALEGDPCGAFDEPLDYALSLTDGQVKRITDSIDGHWHSGSAVSHGVMSFTGDYLERHDVLSDVTGLPHDSDGRIDDRAVPVGAYHGRVDAARLKHAVAVGLTVSGLITDSPAWIAIITTDASCVHCLWTIASNGDGRVSRDEVEALRQGIDRYRGVGESNGSNNQGEA